VEGCPPGWAEGLRNLAWPACSAATVGWLQQLRGITALSLAAGEVFTSPELRRCAWAIFRTPEVTDPAALILHALV
jgi:hypothetical protein